MRHEAAVDRELAAEIKRQFVAGLPAAPEGGRDVRWARRIVARAAAGQPVTPTVLKMARDALAGRICG